MDDCHVPAKNRNIAYSPTRESSLIIVTKKKYDPPAQSPEINHAEWLRRVKMHGVRSWLIPDKSTLQNHYVEINIDRSHQ